MDLSALGTKFKQLDETGRYELFLKLYEMHGDDNPLSIEELLLEKDPMVKLIFLQYLEEIPDQKAIHSILCLMQDSNMIVRQNAVRSFGKNQCRKKHALLRPYILNDQMEMATFAIKTLSRLRDNFILPTLLTRLQESTEKLQIEILKALRYLPDVRSKAIVLPFIDSPNEDVRYYALAVLSELQRVFHSLPLDLFLKKAWDSSSRIRKIALTALEMYSTKKIARIFLNKALQEESNINKMRAIQALSSFPNTEWILPLISLMVHETDGNLKLTVEATLKRFPGPILCEGLIPLLKNQEWAIRHQSATLLAEINGNDPSIRKRLFQLWDEAKGVPEKLGMIATLREMGGEDTVPIFLSLLKENALLAYSAISALNRLWTEKTAHHILEVLKDPKIENQAKQTLLQVIARYGPYETIRDDLFLWLIENLNSHSVNFRYIIIQILAWYPFHEAFSMIFTQLEFETDETVQNTAHAVILKGLGKNPMPLVKEVIRFSGNRKILEHFGHIIRKGMWLKSYRQELLNSLMDPPLDLLKENPDILFPVLVSLLEKEILNLEHFWKRILTQPLRQQFLLTLKESLKDSHRFFPSLSLNELLYGLKDPNSEYRLIVLEIFELNGHQEHIPALVDSALQEWDPGCLKQSNRTLARMILSLEK